MIDHIAIAIAGAALALVVASIWIPQLAKVRAWAAGAIALVSAYALGRGQGETNPEPTDKPNDPPKPETLPDPDRLRVDVERNRDDHATPVTPVGPNGRIERLEERTK